jgi:hypothetical protein
VQHCKFQACHWTWFWGNWIKFPSYQFGNIHPSITVPSPWCSIWPPNVEYAIFKISLGFYIMWKEWLAGIFQSIILDLNWNEKLEYKILFSCFLLQYERYLKTNTFSSRKIVYCSSFNTQYGIVGVPTVMLFHNGRPAAKFNDSEYTLEMFSRFITKYTGNVKLCLQHQPDITLILSVSWEAQTIKWLAVNWMAIVHFLVLIALF